MTTKMIKWVKPNGSTITTNSLAATVAYAMELGWELDDGKAPADTVTDDTGATWDERLHQKNKALDDAGAFKYKKGVNAESAAAILAAD